MMQFVIFVGLLIAVGLTVWGIVWMVDNYPGVTLSAMMLLMGGVALYVVWEMAGAILNK